MNWARTAMERLMHFAANVLLSPTAFAKKRPYKPTPAIDRLEKIKELHEKGMISKYEYASIRNLLAQQKI